MNAGAARQTRDAIGGELYRQCCAALGVAVRLTRERRVEIAERVDAEARMHGDSLAEAEAFLGRWRRARHLRYRERVVGPSADYIEDQMTAQGVDLMTVETVVHGE